MATFGNTSTTVSSPWALWDGFLQGTKFTLPEAAVLTSGAVYGRCESSGNTQKLRITIYADDAGALGALQDVTAEIVADYNSGSPKWWTANFTGQTLSAGDYWIVAWGGTVSGDKFQLSLQTSGGNGAHYNTAATYH